MRRWEVWYLVWEKETDPMPRYEGCVGRFWTQEVALHLCKSLDKGMVTGRVYVWDRWKNKAM